VRQSPARQQRSGGQGGIAGCGRHRNEARISRRGYLAGARARGAQGRLRRVQRTSLARCKAAANA